MKQTEIARLRLLAELAKRESDRQWSSPVTDFCSLGPTIIDELEKLSRKRRVTAPLDRHAALVEHFKG